MTHLKELIILDRNINMKLSWVITNQKEDIRANLDDLKLNNIQISFDINNTNNNNSIISINKEVNNIEIIDTTPITIDNSNTTDNTNTTISDTDVININSTEGFVTISTTTNKTTNNNIGGINNRKSLTKFSSYKSSIFTL